MRRGILLLGAHFGSYEATRVLGINQPHIRFRTVIDIDQNPAMSRLLNSLNPELAATVINPGKRVPASRSRSGMPWARARSSRCLRTGCARAARRATRRFSGASRSSDEPREIAAALGVPVVACFGVYRGSNRYHLQFETLADQIVRERDGGRPLADWIQVFADRLERQVRGAPLNWFNFYDFWPG